MLEVCAGSERSNPSFERIHNGMAPRSAAGSRGDGSIHCFQSGEELTRFFQGVADTYRRDGYRSSRESYNLVRTGSGWQILVSTFHLA